MQSLAEDPIFKGCLKVKRRKFIKKLFKSSVLLSVLPFFMSFKEEEAFKADMPKKKARYYKKLAG